jgi:hypothetical protein
MSRHGRFGLFALKKGGGKLGASSAPAATAGTVPVWGRTGSFVIDVDGVLVRIEQDGIFGVGASSVTWLNFRRAWRPSFIGCHADMAPRRQGARCPRVRSGEYPGQAVMTRTERL